MKSSIEKDFRSGRVENYETLGSTLSKIKSTTIETGMKYALATGIGVLKIKKRYCTGSSKINIFRNIIITVKLFLQCKEE